jgi:hypothetical protein
VTLLGSPAVSADGGGKGGQEGQGEGNKTESRPLGRKGRADSSGAAEHASYSGTVIFRNVFVGELPAAEYPKINVSPPSLSSSLARPSS